MDTMNSIKNSYGKVNEAEDLALKRKTAKRFIYMGLSVAVLVAIIISSVVAVAVHSRRNNSPKPRPNSTPELTPAASLKTVCSVTRYPSSCISSISKFPASNTTDPEVLFKLSLKVVADELNSISDLPTKLAEGTNDERIKSALGVCGDLFDDAIDRVNATVSAMEVGDGKNILNSTKIDDLKTWLSAALTSHDTCLDALDELVQIKTDYANSTITQKLKSAMVNSGEYTSNSLAIVAKVLSTLSDFGIPIHRRRLLNSADSFPHWVSPRVRRLLQAKNLTPNVVVAADGSGDVKTVNEAVARVPNKGNTVFVIYVKAGTYVENVLLDKSKWNVLMYGDGQEKTIISGSRNWAKGTPTFQTATFATQGQGFMMKDIKIINTAGPEKHQAVAFRSGADLSVYYQCSFDGFQDTLYPHSNRQFYRNCDVTGTVDFIFGAATVVFQDCTIRPRQPLKGQYITITAEGKKDQNQNSGTTIQRCTISPNGNVTAEVYLGRPWKEFSTTVIMQSVIGSFVNPAGWHSWEDNKEPPSTILYGEYKNSGPGSDVSNRVKWAGYKPVMSDAEAARFTVANFLRGGDWLPAMGVPFQQT
ncbi:PREDICTED: pectinesterase 1-like [Camelina sativa]|uniref:Pectinesterase n=1 Tax=Camelina sativa TaxID=90675 RepID=A0ABM0XKB5_CAMSA|nr:PREDICTED: pectinesterase 1-like [Camelina sativa]